MSTIVYRISVLLGVLLAAVPVGTNLALFWLLWALISGRSCPVGGPSSRHWPTSASRQTPCDALERL
jgi:hypothetical protein